MCKYKFAFHFLQASLYLLVKIQFKWGLCRKTYTHIFFVFANLSSCLSTSKSTFTTSQLLGHPWNSRVFSPTHTHTNTNQLPFLLKHPAELVFCGWFYPLDWLLASQRVRTSLTAHPTPTFGAAPILGRLDSLEAKHYAITSYPSSSATFIYSRWMKC